MSHVPFSANVVGYDPHHTDYIDPRRSMSIIPTFQQSPRNRRMSMSLGPVPAQPPHQPARTSPRSAGQPTGRGQTEEVTNAQLFEMIKELQDEIMEVRGENMVLKQTLNVQAHHIAEITQKCDDLDQYGRRENVCFTNLKVTEERPCAQQVVELCHELGVEVATSDLVDAHPLPSKRGRGNRCIARFRDRKKAQDVFAARKRSKDIDPTKKLC